MNNQKMMMIGAAAVIAFLVMKKAKGGTIAPPLTLSKNVPTGPTKNVNNQMWQSILGSGWTSLVGGSTSSDGKPLNTDVPTLGAINMSPGANIIDYGDGTLSDGTPLVDVAFPSLSGMVWQ